MRIQKIQEGSPWFAAIYALLVFGLATSAACTWTN